MENDDTLWPPLTKGKGRKEKKKKVKDRISVRKWRKKTVKMEDTKVPRVKEFKYLGSTEKESRNCEKE